MLVVFAACVLVGLVAWVVAGALLVAASVLVDFA